MHYADEYGNIPLTDNNYIRVVNRSRMLLPVYHQNSKSIEQVITDLFDNIFESWNGAIEPFLAISFIAMSPYCPEFWDKECFCRRYRSWKNRDYRIRTCIIWL